MPFTPLARWPPLTLDWQGLLYKLSLCCPAARASDALGVERGSDPPLSSTTLAKAALGFVPNAAPSAGDSPSLTRKSDGSLRLSIPIEPLRILLLVSSGLPSVLLSTSLGALSRLRDSHQVIPLGGSTAATAFLSRSRTLLRLWHWRLLGFCDHFHCFGLGYRALCGIECPLA